MGLPSSPRDIIDRLFSASKRDQSQNQSKLPGYYPNPSQSTDLIDYRAVG